MTRTPYSKVAIAAALAALGFATGTMAQSTATAPKADAKSATAGKGALAGDDRTFAMKAAQGGMMEVEAGKAAQSKAQHDSVKQFAQKMVDDHGKANAELMSLAKSKGVDLPPALDKEHKAHMDMMAKKSGADFDREYMKHMVDDHKKTVADFEKQSKSGKDADLRKWAGDKLPTLREHMKMAESTHAQVAKGGAAGGSAASKTSGTSDPAKPVETANSKGNTAGTNSQNIAGAAPKAQTTGK